MTHAEWQAALRREPAPRTEARVLRAVITEPDKLALADAVEVDDFTHPASARAFAHVRDLQASETEVDAIAICDADELRRRAYQTTDENAMAIHLRDHVFALAQPYEIEFGFAAALGVFEADRYQLSAIADARKAA